MKTLALLVVLMSGCVDQDSKPTPATGTVDDACGPRPDRPGWSAAFENGQAHMSTADYNNMLTWSDDMDAWADCAWLL